MTKISKKATSYSETLLTHPNPNDSTVQVYAEDGYGLIVGFRDADPLPPNSYINKVGKTYEKTSRRAQYLDLLQRSNPIYVHFNTDKKMFKLSTVDQLEDAISEELESERPVVEAV